MKKIKVGDTVKILSGKDKGKTGEVVARMTKREKLVVKGINIITKHKKQDANSKQSGRFKIEAPISESKVMLVNPQDGKPTRIKFEVDQTTGKKSRISVKTNKSIA